MAPALSSRDMLVFDQRGTGESDPLSCRALEPGGGAGIRTLGQLVQRCGEQIGEARSGYSTAESVQDIEAIRQAAGYEKLVLYGTSYGTKVAEQYAETYPSHVEALVLDSVVPPEGEEPFKVSTFEAIRSVFAEMCSQHALQWHRVETGLRARRACVPAETAPPERHRLRRRREAPTGMARGGKPHGSAARRRPATPRSRAMMPAAVYAALHHDPAALLRLKLLSEGLVPSLPRGRRRKTPDEVDSALLIDTTCEDTPYPGRGKARPPPGSRKRTPPSTRGQAQTSTRSTGRRR